jgi:hypothetical protein
MHVAQMEEKRTEYRLLVGKPEGKRLLGKPRRTWVDSIKKNAVLWDVTPCDSFKNRRFLGT